MPLDVDKITRIFKLLLLEFSRLKGACEDTTLPLLEPTLKARKLIFGIQIVSSKLPLTVHYIYLIQTGIWARYCPQLARYIKLQAKPQLPRVLYCPTQKIEDMMQHVWCEFYDRIYKAS
jgi:hypothetical protein